MSCVGVTLVTWHASPHTSTKVSDAKLVPEMVSVAAPASVVAVGETLAAVKLAPCTTTGVLAAALS